MLVRPLGIEDEAEDSDPEDGGGHGGQAGDDDEGEQVCEGLYGLVTPSQGDGY